jgi:hypothetical protein
VIKIIVCLCLLSVNSHAGMDFRFRHSEADLRNMLDFNREVKMNHFQRLEETDYHASIGPCYALIIEGKYLVHLFPEGDTQLNISKQQYFDLLIGRILDPHDRVVLVTSSGINEKASISPEDIIQYVQIRGVEVDVYPEQTSGDGRLIFANRSNWRVFDTSRGAGVYCGSYPIRREE